MPITSGSSLGGYRIVRLLGSGGMGEVYAAEDLRLHRLVALKVLPSPLAVDPERRQRFEREATAVAALNHPGIVTIHSVEQADGVPFLTMELVEGKSLADTIPRKGLPLDTFLTLGIQLVDAIAAAHQRGVTHRDLKPANVMIAAENRIKVLDFGLAKLRDADVAVAGQTALATEKVTGEGHIIGTAAYMSPEQAAGRPVDHRTDIFSLGVVLYEMATGERPFKGDTPVTTISSIIKDTPPLITDVNPALPGDLSRIVRHALAKDPERRYQTAKDLRNDLEELRETVASSASSVRSKSRPRSRWLRAVTFGGAAAAVAAAALWGWRRPGRVGETPAARVDFSISQVTSQPTVEMFPSLSPDGRWIVYCGNATDNLDIYLQSVGGSTPIDLTKDSLKDDWQAAFSPDGERIVFRSEREGGGLFVMGRTGESVTRLTDAGFNPAWSPRGTEIAYAEEGVFSGTGRGLVSHIWIVDVATRQRRRLTEGDAVQPSWSPHGQRIAYWAVGGANRVRDIWTITVTGGQPVPVTSDAHVDWNPVWTPDGKHLYFISDRGGSMNLWRVAIDESSGRALSSPEPVTTPSPSVAHLTFSADGHRLAFNSELVKSNIYSVAFDPVAGTARGAPAPITVGTRQWSVPDPSPDGQWIAFFSGVGQQDIYVSRLDGTGLRQLTNDTVFDRVPRWSPDGSRIAFHSNRAGTQQLWTIRADGSDLVQLTNYPGSGVIQAAWSPDGNHVIGFSQSAKTLVMFDLRKPLQERTGEELPKLPDDKMCNEAVWSPDGKTLACVAASSSGSATAIAVYSFANRTYTLFVEEGNSPVWLNDSRRLLFTSQQGKLMLLDTRSKKVAEVLSLLPEAAFFPRVTRDNRRIVFARWSDEGDIYMLTFK